jgi:hypothetical protein
MPFMDIRIKYAMYYCYQRESWTSDKCYFKSVERIYVFSLCLLLAWLTLQPWRQKQDVPLKCHWTSTRLHVVTPHSSYSLSLST